MAVRLSVMIARLTGPAIDILIPSNVSQCPQKNAPNMLVEDHLWVF